MGRPLVWLYGLDGQRQIPLHDLRFLEIEDRLSDLEIMRFTVRADDPKARFIIADQLCEYDGRVYRTEEIDEVREGRIALVKVYAEASWMDLGKRSRPDVFTVLGKTVADGLADILDGSGWTIGTVPVLATLYSMEDIDASVLKLVQRWASITGYEVEWDTVNKTVSFVSALGQDRGIGFRWGYNLLSVQRRFRPPIATRLYPFGANSLDIIGANPSGEEYVEDYSWYTLQGLTITQARDLYRKDQIWVDSRFISPINLYDAALRRIAALAQPRITYELQVAELSRLTASPADDVEIGDVVRVRDRDFNIDLTTRVVRLVKDELEPQRNQVELDYLEPGLGTTVVEAGAARTIDYGQIVILTDYNEFGQSIGISTVVWAAIQITVTGNSVVVLGGTFVGTATGADTVRFQATIDGSVIGDPYDVPFVDGQRVEFSWPTWDDLPEGTYIVDWRARCLNGTGNINTAVEACRGFVIARGAVGVGQGGNANQFLVEEIFALSETSIESLSDEWTVVITDVPPIDEEFVETIPELEANDLEEVIEDGYSITFTTPDTFDVDETVDVAADIEELVELWDVLIEDA